MTPGRVLFLAHEAERTGPPVVLLALLRWLAERTELDVHVLFLAGGPLLPEFERVAHVWRTPDASDVPRPDLVVVNTAISIQGLRSLPDWDVPVVTVVHELDTGLVEHLPPPDYELLRARTHGYVAPAECIAANLRGGHAVAPDRVAVCREIIDEPGPSSGPGFARTQGRPVVGGAGVVQWRKGVDLFVALADLVVERRDADFVWLGGPLTGPFAEQVAADVQRAGLADRVHLVGPQSDPIDWFRTFDIFALPTREDSMPLVLLEAAAVGVPLATFDVGCLRELVTPCGGRLVRYPRVEDLADHVVALLDDSEERSVAAARGRAFVRAHHATPVAAPALWDAVVRMAR